MPAGTLVGLLAAIEAPDVLNNPRGFARAVGEEWALGELSYADGVAALVAFDRHREARARALHEGWARTWHAMNPPLARDEPAGAGRPLFDSTADYEAYRAAHAAYVPPRFKPGPSALPWMLDLADAAMQETRDEIAGQIEAARKAVCAALAKGATSAEVLGIARKSATEAAEADLVAMVEQEAAWWLRWRHDAGFRRQMASEARDAETQARIDDELARGDAP